MYLHSNKENNRGLAQELGLREKATEEFTYACYEVVLDLEVDPETGRYEILAVDGHALASKKAVITIASKEERDAIVKNFRAQCAQERIAEYRENRDNLLQDLLRLVMERPPSLASIGTWTPKQRSLAEEWAVREYLSANDNPINRDPRPEFLP